MKSLQIHNIFLFLLQIYLKNLNLQHKTAIIYKNKQPTSLQFY